jgi:hypothetical protein
MKRYRTIAILVVGLCVSLIMSACGAPSSGSGAPGGPSASQPNAQPTVARPKPQSMPTLDLAFCQKILTIAEANSIMKPATPATTIRIDHSSDGGSCNYEYAQFKSVVTITFLPFSGGDPQQVLDTAASQITSKTANIPNAKVSTTKVSSVGDAALFVTAAASVQGITFHDVGLDVVYGKLFISCANFRAGSSSDATQLGYLTQIAQLIVGRI